MFDLFWTISDAIFHSSPHLYCFLIPFPKMGLDGNKVIIAKEGTDYIVYINEVNISDGFENFSDAELGAKEAIREVIQKTGNK